MVEYIKLMFLSHHLEVLEKSLYLGKTSIFSILANGLAMMLEHFRNKKPKFFYFSNVVGDALRQLKYINILIKNSFPNYLLISWILWFRSLKYYEKTKGAFGCEKFITFTNKYFKKNKTLENAGCVWFQKNFQFSRIIFQRKWKFKNPVWFN